MCFGGDFQLHSRDKHQELILCRIHLPSDVWVTRSSGLQAWRKSQLVLQDHTRLAYLALPQGRTGWAGNQTPNLRATLTVWHETRCSLRTATHEHTHVRVLEHVNDQWSMSGHPISVNRVLPYRPHVVHVCGVRDSLPGIFWRQSGFFQASTCILDMYQGQSWEMGIWYWF